MIVFRISIAKYSNSLTASGARARWNRAGEFVLYTAMHRSLSALELLARRHILNSDFKYGLMEIELDLKPNQIFKPTLKKVDDSWKSHSSYDFCNEIGSAWYNKNKYLAMQVPSVLIPEESNFIINTRHKDFYDKVELKKTNDFYWDRRLI